MHQGVPRINFLGRQLDLFRWNLHFSFKKAFINRFIVKREQLRATLFDNLVISIFLAAADWIVLQIELFQICKSVQISELLFF